MKLGYGVMSIIACGFLALGAQPLTLSSAYELALKNEPHLRSLSLRTEAIKETVAQSKAKMYPQVQGSLSWGSYEYDAEYLKSPVNESYKSYSISASQPIFHPEVWRGIDSSKSRQKAATFELQAEAQKLGLDVAKAYFNLLKTKRNVELLASQSEYYRTKYKEQEEKLKFGLTNRIDLLEAKVHSDKAMSELLAEQKRSKVAALRLEHYIKEPIGELPNFDFAMVDPGKLFREGMEWESKLGNNPTLQASLASEEMATHEAAIRKYQHYPKVDLSLARKKTYTQDTVSHQYDNQAIVQMSIPIYEGGYTQSRVREGKMLLESAQNDVEYNRLDTKQRFEELWAESQLNVETLQVLKESEKSAKLYLDSMELANKAGLKSLLDVLEAKAKFYEVKRDTINAGYELVNNYLSLLDVTGELNSDNIAFLENMAISQGEQ